MAKKGKKKGGMCRIPIIVGALAAMAVLPSCQFMRDWADASQPVPVDPSLPAGPVQDPTLPHIGGTDPLDLVATVLAMLGLAPAARLLTLAKPFIASLILAIMGRKKKAEEPKPQ